MVCSDNTKKLLIFSKIKGIGPKALTELVNKSDFDQLSIEEIAKYSKKLYKFYQNDSSILIDAENMADKDIFQSIESGSRIISFLDNDYPQLLNNCFDKPPLLYVKGNLNHNSEKTVAVIGTREPTNHGKIITKKISEYFLNQDWSIVSGLAIGCDTIAHQAAVEARGHTVAVLSHGLQTIAPKQNYQLAKTILDTGGALVTTYAFGVEAKPFQFVARDRVQAALSKAVVMVQSDKKGGSLHASRASLEYGRILAVPYPTDQDINAKASKVEANLIMANGNTNEKTELLKCEESDLDNLFIIKSKEDYKTLMMQIEKQTDYKGQGSFKW